MAENCPILVVWDHTLPPASASELVQETPLPIQNKHIYIGKKAF